MDNVEKIGLLTLDTWNAEVQRRGSNFGGIQPSDIGVLGPFTVGSMELLMMACDEHMTSEEGHEEPAYEFARQYAALMCRLAIRESILSGSEYERKYNAATKKAQRERTARMRAEAAARTADPRFAASSRVNGCREWFIENATWTEVP